MFRTRLYYENRIAKMMNKSEVMNARLIKKLERKLRNMEK